MRRLPTFAIVTAVLLLGACELTGTDVPDAEPDPVAKAAPAPLPQARILFLHRSVGGRLVRDGQPDMYETLAQLNQEHGTSNQLWHHFCGTPPYWNRY